MGPVEVLWDGDEVPPERTWDQWKYYGMRWGTPRVWTDTCENSTFPILRLRAVKNMQFETNIFSHNILQKNNKLFKNYSKELKFKINVLPGEHGHPQRGQQSGEFCHAQTVHLSRVRNGIHAPG